LSFAFHAWFWLGSWIFYYLRFGDYASVALLDSGAVAVTLLMEIPTGAFADLLGKRKTLILAFLLQGTGNIVMGLSGSFWMLALSLWLLTCVGGAFYSGALEALVFDSLKSMGEDHRFDKVMGGISATKLWSMALCGVIGGFSYYIAPGLPFILNGIVCLVGFIVCLWLNEPTVDTEKHSLADFFRQNTLGIKTLFGSVSMKQLSLFLTMTGAFMVVSYEILEDLLAIEFGYSPMGISILFSVACLVAGLISVYIPRWKIQIDHKVMLVVSVMIVAVTRLLSPWIGMMAFGGLTLLGIVSEVVYNNSTSVLVNQNTESKVRATTLSTLSLLRSLPYAMGGSLVGALVLLSGGAKNFSLWFGLILVGLTLLLSRGIKKPA